MGCYVMGPELFIGTGGWQYFIVPDRDPLKEYSKIFNFVEVNSTFYKNISSDMVRAWRRKVSHDFKFSVRAHRIVTHKYYLKPVKEVVEAMERTMDIADILGCDVIVLETPPRLTVTKERLHNFMSAIDLRDKYIALEIRGNKPKETIHYMEKNDEIIPVYDISREEPPYHHQTIEYARVFGKGRHNIYQLTNKEIERIYRRATNAPVKMVLISFHGVRMYKDAGKLRYYYLYKDFPKNKPPYGLDALKAELARDMKFPASRDEIIRHEGWKVIPLDEKRDIHLGDILSWLPPGTYRDIEQVVATLRKQWPGATENKQQK